MKGKALGIMAAVTVTVIVAAVFLARETPNGIPESGHLLFPELKAHLNEVEEITVSSAKHTVTITRGEKFWRVKEKKGYPAAMGKVRKVLIGLAELTILEPKTQNPDLYEKLGLQDPQAEGSSSTALRLINPKGEPLAALILGNRRPAKGDSSRDEIYSRKPKDPQTWLTIGRLKLEKRPDEWIERRILNIDSQRVRRVSVTHPGGETVTIQKDNPTDPDFTIMGLPKNRKVASQFTVNNIADSIAHLSLDDVFPEKEARVSGSGVVKAALDTFDGLRVTLRMKEQEGKHFARVVAEFDSQLMEKPKQEKEEQEKDKGKQDAEVVGKASEESPPSRLKSEADVQQEAKEITETLGEWTYVIQKFRADNIAKRRVDLTTKKS